MRLLQVVTVPVEIVAEGTGAAVLDGRSGGDDAPDLLIPHRPAGSRHDGLVHGHLVIVVFRELLVAGVLGIGPGLVPKHHRLPGDTLKDKLDELMEIGLVGFILAAAAALLLETHIVPGFVGKGLNQGEGLGFDAFPIPDFPVLVVRNIALGILPVPLQGAAADIHVADDDRNAGRIGDFPQILFHAIDGETVSDRKQTEGIPLRGGGRIGGDTKADGQQQEESFHHSTTG